MMAHPLKFLVPLITPGDFVTNTFISIIIINNEKIMMWTIFVPQQTCKPCQDTNVETCGTHERCETYLWESLILGRKGSVDQVLKYSTTGTVEGKIASSTVH
jgi:hypothetical protein